MKLPHSKKKFVIFMGIISVISVNITAPLVACLESGFYLYVWKDVLTVFPLIWPSVIAIVTLTCIPAEKMTEKIVSKGDSFRAHIVVNILCTVFLMSILLMVIGTWIGTRSITWKPIRMFFYKWPRNFSVALFVEMCVAQPAARFVIYRLQLRADREKDG